MVRETFQTAADTAKPKIFIVIDDVKDMNVDKVTSAATGARITCAFLPDGSSQVGLDRTRQAGHDTIIHMPMEPVGYRERGIGLEKNTLMTDMSSAEISSIMSETLKRFSKFTGINNHMGSAAVQDPRLMDTVMRTLKEKGLTFLDSFTIKTDVPRDKARQHGVPYLRRDVFLDHEINEAKIREQFDKAGKIAAEKGTAIAIGHPHKETLKVMKEWIAENRNRFDFVPISAHRGADMRISNAQDLETRDPHATAAYKLPQSIPSA